MLHLLGFTYPKSLILAQLNEFSSQTVLFFSIMYSALVRSPTSENSFQLSHWLPQFSAGPVLLHGEDHPFLACPCAGWHPPAFGMPAAPTGVTPTVSTGDSALGGRQLPALVRGVGLKQCRGLCRLQARDRASSSGGLKALPR